MTRKSIKVNIKKTESESYNKQNERTFLRFFYKPCDGGTLWAYNRKTLPFRNFAEIPLQGAVGT